MRRRILFCAALVAALSAGAALAGVGTLSIMPKGTQLIFR